MWALCLHYVKRSVHGRYSEICYSRTQTYSFLSVPSAHLGYDIDTYCFVTFLSSFIYVPRDE